MIFVLKTDNPLLVWLLQNGYTEEQSFWALATFSWMGGVFMGVGLGILLAPRFWKKENGDAANNP